MLQKFQVRRFPWCTRLPLFSVCCWSSSAHGSPPSPHTSWALHWQTTSQERIFHPKLEGNDWLLRDGFRAWQGDDILHLYFYCISWLEGSHLKHLNGPKVKDVQMSKIKCVEVELAMCQWITQWTLLDSLNYFFNYINVSC